MTEENEEQSEVQRPDAAISEDGSPGAEQRRLDEAAELAAGSPFGTEPQVEDESGSFVVLAIALLVMVGASVYFVGQLLNAKSETDAAQAQAEETLAEFDPFEFSDEFATDETAPSSLPLSDAPVDDDSNEPAVETTTTTTIARPSVNPDDIVFAFVNRVPGDEYGRAGYLDRNGERHVTELECDRLDLNRNGGICLSATAGIRGTGRGLLLDASLNPTTRFGVSSPSRAAASPDGAVVSWTGFTLGHSYLAPGEFATTTQLISVERGIGANLETIFATYRDDVLITDPTRNFWGVTFVDSDRFYATLGDDVGTSIVEGRVSNSRMDVVFENASCPEVSPDGSTIVAKEQRGDAFQLVAIDVATGSRRDLGERISVDDQVEWVDNDTIMYAVPNVEAGTEQQPVFDVYALDIAAGSQPRLIIPFADSPAA